MRRFRCHDARANPYLLLDVFGAWASRATATRSIVRFSRCYDTCVTSYRLLDVFFAWARSVGEVLAVLRCEQCTAPYRLLYIILEWRRIASFENSALKRQDQEAALLNLMDVANERLARAADQIRYILGLSADKARFCMLFRLFADWLRATMELADALSQQVSEQGGIEHPETWMKSRRRGGSTIGAGDGELLPFALFVEEARLSDDLASGEAASAVGEEEQEEAVPNDEERVAAPSQQQDRWAKRQSRRSSMLKACEVAARQGEDENGQSIVLVDRTMDPRREPKSILSKGPSEALAALPDARRDPAASFVTSLSQSFTICPKWLDVRILSARGLRDADLVGQLYPYAVMEVVGKPEARRQTRVIDNSVSPVWDEDFQITCFDVGDVLEVTIWSRDSWPKHDDLLGRLSLRSDEFLPGGIEEELPLVETREHTALLSLVVRPRFG